jgi:hypothetical protein
MNRAAVSLTVVVLAAGCSSTTAATTQAPPTVPTTSLTIPERIETTTTVDPETADAATAERLVGAFDELIAEAEALRGLEFIERPDVLVLQPDAYAARLAERFASVMATAPVVGKTAFYRAAGFLRFEEAEAILRRLPPPPTLVFYDPIEYRLVVSGAADELDPVVRATAVHELVLALTDHHHATSATRATLVADGADDRLMAFDALVEGDATYFQLLYVQSLAPDARAAVAAAFRETDTAVVAAIPDFIRADLAFPYDAGVTFVGDLVATAGIAGVDQSYRDPPRSTEHVLHPERYRRGEIPFTVPPLDLSVAGATTTRSATFGELQLDHLLSMSMQAGLATQAVDGWQGDSYEIVESGGETAFALALLMASEDDAIEVVGGLIAHARDVLEAGDGVEAAGGLLWDSAPGRFVFLDRVGAGLIYVLASDSELGSTVRDQVEAP